ncbi:hypothetical protein LTR91_026562 [Friedmanniomyces endolithicus]|uniref:Uncharacterized protein n=1 Tax=Friedmanniomyces endolithicus TaxID=329885 RepID=A0AAN6GYW6_9PEZI|nr:hypothetical protein LTR59_018224 [Friedmanniomyces endolithicus]KAK0888221.1 hypothetical protein LTR57_025552 [Friedmanniomyces endolithicus]KAK0949312.1 hypothetical protein LTR91_026562 [Friedmanniomyces endolithicus]
MDRKRGIAFIDRLRDGDSPNKSRRLDEHRAEHFGTRASNEGRSVPLETAQYAEALVAMQTLCKANCTVQDSYELDSVVSGTLRALFRAHTLNEMLTRIAEPTVDTAAESECEDFLNDIVNGDVTPVRNDPAFAG